MIEDFNGFLLVDKPKNITSFGVVARVRSILRDLTGKKYKVGHSGTLDPSATGLLILAVGSYTKKLEEVIKKDKKYLVSLKFGYSSSTGDQEGEIKRGDQTFISKKQIEEVLDKFRGEIDQVPPALSAIKIKGKKSYELARKGIEIDLPARKVQIYSNRLIKYNYPDLQCESHVSSGTYVRSLVRDIASDLKTSAYMSDLRRLSIDKVNIDQSTKLADINQDNILRLLKKSI